MGIIEKMRLDGKKDLLRVQQEGSENVPLPHLLRQVLMWQL